MLPGGAVMVTFLQGYKAVPAPAMTDADQQQQQHPIDAIHGIGCRI
jgi:hypothetical protein